MSVANAYKRDAKKALNTYIQAAEEGNALIGAKIGTMYLAGKGAKKSTNKAQYWFRTVAYTLVDYEPEERQDMFRLLIGTRNPPALFAKEINGISSDFFNGSPKVQMAHYNSLKTGKGVKQNPTLAMWWLENAIDAKYPEAYYHLAHHYLAGDTLKADNAQFRINLRHAAQAGYVKAQRRTWPTIFRGRRSTCSAAFGTDLVRARQSRGVPMLTN